MRVYWTGGLGWQYPLKYRVSSPVQHKIYVKSNKWTNNKLFNENSWNCENLLGPSGFLMAPCGPNYKNLLTTLSVRRLRPSKKEEYNHSCRSLRKKRGRTDRSRSRGPIQLRFRIGPLMRCSLVIIPIDRSFHFSPLRSPSLFRSLACCRIFRRYRKQSGGAHCR